MKPKTQIPQSPSTTMKKSQIPNPIACIVPSKTHNPEHLHEI